MAYRPGDQVWAKVEGYRWWPATVLDPKEHAEWKGGGTKGGSMSGAGGDLRDERDEKRVLVRFHHTNDFGSLRDCKILDFETHKREKSRGGKKASGFAQAVAAAEAASTRAGGGSALNGAGVESGGERPAAAPTAAKRRTPTKPPPSKPPQPPHAHTSSGKTAAEDETSIVAATPDERFKGVFRLPGGAAAARWEARVDVSGATVDVSHSSSTATATAIGVFPTPEEAAQAHDVALVAALGASKCVGRVNFSLEMYGGGGGDGGGGGGGGGASSARGAGPGRRAAAARGEASRREVGKNGFAVIEGALGAGVGGGGLKREEDDSDDDDDDSDDDDDAVARSSSSDDEESEEEEGENDEAQTREDALAAFAARRLGGFGAKSRAFWCVRIYTGPHTTASAW